MSYDRDLLIEAISMLASGTPIVIACKQLGIPRTTFYYAIGKDQDLLNMLARAREEYAESIVCEMREIAETVEDVSRAKLLCDNIKWEAARMAPKKYGDRTALDLGGQSDNPIIHASLPPDEAYKLMLNGGKLPE